MIRLRERPFLSSVVSPARARGEEAERTGGRERNVLAAASIRRNTVRRYVRYVAPVPDAIRV